MPNYAVTVYETRSRTFSLSSDRETVQGVVELVANATDSEFEEWMDQVEPGDLEVDDFWVEPCAEEDQ